MAHAALEQERRGRGIELGLGRAIGLVCDGRGALAGVCACLDPTDARVDRIAGAAFLLETALGELQNLQGRPAGAPDGA